MKHILMIATGGTIASENKGEGLSPALSFQDLLKAVPEISSICKVEAVQPFNLDSTNIFHEHWLKIASLIEENYSSFDGFVITHGTDTMAFTSAALSYLVQKSPKPIILTGSQKSMSFRDTDARKNLSDAFMAASDDRAFGVRVVFDGNVLLGTRAKKTKTRSFDAFSSVDFPPLAVVRDGKLVWYVQEEKPCGPVFYRKLDPNVFVLKMIPGLRAEIFEYLSERFEGLILETFGSGGLPGYENGAFYSELKKFLDKGKTVVVTTQVEREGSALSSYEVGRKLLSCGKVLEARSMTLEAAVSKLMWTIAETKEDREALFSAPVDHDIF